MVLSPGSRRCGLGERALPPFFFGGRLCFFPPGFLEAFVGDISIPYFQLQANPINNDCSRIQLKSPVRKTPKSTIITRESSVRLHQSNADVITKWNEDFRQADQVTITD